MKLNVDITVDHFREVAIICDTLADCRDPRGVRYNCGIIMFSIFLSECAQRFNQRAKQIWIALNWNLILILWNQYSSNYCKRTKAFSQPSISRLLNSVEYEAFSSKLNQNTRDNFEVEWEKVKEERTLNINKTKSSSKDKRKRNRISHGKFPQYSLDGKSRKGVVSVETGRTEIDLTIYNPDTNSVIAQKTLPDKEGEAVAAEELIIKTSPSIPEGVFTADAGITSPRVTSAIKNNNHHYILAIKGNAGKIYDEIKNFNWSSISTTYIQYSDGHGRREIRKLKKINLSQLPGKEYEKYSGAKFAYKAENQTSFKKDDKFVLEDRFFISDEAVGQLTLPQIATYIRGHWAQESYHWVKDVILNEDNCPQKTANGSRILSSIRSKVFTLGKKFCGSVKEFTDRFVSKPEIFLGTNEKKRL